jgi:hypothetical protein
VRRRSSCPSSWCRGTARIPRHRSSGAATVDGVMCSPRTACPAATRSNSSTSISQRWSATRESVALVVADHSKTSRGKEKRRSAQRGSHVTLPTWRRGAGSCCSRSTSSPASSRRRTGLAREVFPATSTGSRRNALPSAARPQLPLVPVAPRRRRAARRAGPSTSRPRCRASQMAQRALMVAAPSSCRDDFVQESGGTRAQAVQGRTPSHAGFGGTVLLSLG